MSVLPAGTVTFLFTDIEGSTRLLQELGVERYAEALSHHRTRVRDALCAHGGVEFGTEGDAFFVAFAEAADGLAAAEAIQAALADGSIRVRIGIHTGEPLVVDGDYVGLDIHKVARICSAAHGGQVLVSQRTQALAGRPLLDLGEHRLKDLAAAERLFQLGAAEFPPLRTLRQANLPVQPSPLLGRDEELAEARELVAASRLLTLTGPGGTGKTRLALALAAELAGAHPDGAWWVPLAAVSDPALVVPTIGEVVGARGDVVEHLAPRRLLLVLDNLEQVLDAARDIAALLAAAPGLHIIATSRERLAIAGEQEYWVPPLGEKGAAELFVTRARQVRPDFAATGAVEEICRRLDRLPLALELAATRVKIMSAAQILARLESRLSLLAAGARDLPPRQATMRATIAWSYDLLSRSEQRLFRALGVFVGSADLEAVEAVADAQLDELQSLVDKSLLRQRSDGRFFLLETTREFALEQLTQLEEAEVRAHHAEFFLQLGASARTGVRSAQQREWLDRLRAETDNLRAALRWTLDHDVTRGVDLADALFELWHMRGQLPELITWFERALEQRPAIDPPVLARGLFLYGWALSYCGPADRAERALRESLEASQTLRDCSGEAWARTGLGSVAWAAGDHERSIELQEQALETFREHGDRAGIARALHLLGECLRDVGEHERAAAVLDESIAVERELGNHHRAMASLHSLGDLALDCGAARVAESRYLEALATCVELEDDRSQAYCVAGLAAVAALDADDEAAGRCWGLAEAIERRHQLRMLAGERARYERLVEPLRDQPGFRAGYDAGSEAQPKQAVLALL